MTSTPVAPDGLPLIENPTHVVSADAGNRYGRTAISFFAAALAEAGVPFFASRDDFYEATINPDWNLVFIALNEIEVLPYLRTPGASAADDATNKDGSDWAKVGLSASNLSTTLAATLAAAEFLTIDSGVFTPTITFETPGTLSVNYTTGLGLQRGDYIRLGRLVKCTVNLNSPTITKGDASGKLRLAFSDLPFTPDTQSMGMGQIRVRSANISIPNGPQPLIVVPGQKYLEFGCLQNGSAIAYVQAGDVTNGATLLQVTFEFWVS